MAFILEKIEHQKDFRCFCANDKNARNRSFQEILSFQVSDKWKFDACQLQLIPSIVVLPYPNFLMHLCIIKLRLLCWKSVGLLLEYVDFLLELWEFFLQLNAKLKVSFCSIYRVWDGMLSWFIRVLQIIQRREMTILDDVYSCFVRKKFDYKIVAINSQVLRGRLDLLGFLLHEVFIQKNIFCLWLVGESILRMNILVVCLR